MNAAICKTRLFLHARDLSKGQSDVWIFFEAALWHFTWSFLFCIYFHPPISHIQLFKMSFLLHQVFLVLEVLCCYNWRGNYSTGCYCVANSFRPMGRGGTMMKKISHTDAISIASFSVYVALLFSGHHTFNSLVIIVGRIHTMLHSLGLCLKALNGVCWFIAWLTLLLNAPYHLFRTKKKKKNVSHCLRMSCYLNL